MPNFGGITVTDQEVKGIWGLLDLLGNSKGEEAKALLTELTKARDEAAALAQQATTDKAEIQAMLAAMKPRQDKLAQDEKNAKELMAQAQQLKREFEQKHAEFRRIAGG